MVRSTESVHDELGGKPVLSGALPVGALDDAQPVTATFTATTAASSDLGDRTVHRPADSRHVVTTLHH